MDDLRDWAEALEAPPCPPVCGHVRIERQHYPDGAPNGVACLDCPAFWYEHSIDISDDECAATLAFMAQRLDNK